MIMAETSSRPAEAQPINLAERFHSLASAMDSDEVKPIFRRFGDLNLLNLLHLQSELLVLRGKFDAILVKTVHHDQGYLASYPLGYKTHGNESNSGDEENIKLKWELFDQLRKKVKEYSMFFDLSVVIHNCTNINQL